MLVLGIAGGISPIHEKPYDLPPGITHDAAAALLDDGNVIAAIEEERLNRIKHTNKSPISAIRYCLEDCGLRLEDVDKLSIYGSEHSMNNNMRTAYLSRPRREFYKDIRTQIRRLLFDEFKYDLESDRLFFTPHHLAHALSAYIPSGFESSLILTIDGSGGDGTAGMVLTAAGDSLNALRSIPDVKSLGHFYLRVTRFLGYTNFDEYKVMGLAPYGDPEIYRRLFKSFYTLLPNGDYTIDWQKLNQLFDIGPPRTNGDPLTQIHQDIAAALQEAIEEIAFHILKYYKETTGHKNLCLAGGVAHNCTLNGKLLYSELFDEIFVQPAAHDAGCAIGAAFNVFYSERHKISRPTLDHIYWGADVGTDDFIESALTRWSAFLKYEKVKDIIVQAAEMLSSGFVIGWVQGRSEFGPRALGNRSILADPRPAENKEIINAMVKKREAYRPFAPSVMEEYIDEYFDVPPGKKKFPFMTFVVKVRECHHQLLGAITHVDGTARVQTVSKNTNGSFWNLINAFGNRTGVYLLLNTSFNNNAEPIVNSAEDAIVCFLTTNLHYLVVGNYIVSKKDFDLSCYLDLIPSLPRYSRLSKSRRYISRSELATVCEIGNSYDEEYKVSITAEMFDVLAGSCGERTIGNLLSSSGLTGNKTDSIVRELFDLWSKRVILLKPPEKAFDGQVLCASYQTEELQTV